MWRCGGITIALLVQINSLMKARRVKEGSARENRGGKVENVEKINKEQDRGGTQILAQDRIRRGPG